MMTNKWDGHLYATVKVGDRGQVVVPAEARKDLDIKKTRCLLSRQNWKTAKSPTMVKADAMRELAEKIMQGLETPEEA